MKKRIETDVIVIGSGPVGLVLAMEMAVRGVDVAVIETRTVGEPPSPKCNHVSARTMEYLRRLGVADRIRNAGMPRDYPHDVVFCTAMTGYELSRIEIPSANRRGVDLDGPDGWWPTAEPPHRANQMYVEPILCEHAIRTPNVRIFNRTSYQSHVQNESGVEVLAEDLITGEEIAFSGRYLVGCDGGRSAVRKAIGSKFAGVDVVQRVQSTQISAPGLRDLMSLDPAWMYISTNPRRFGTVLSIDGKDRWLIHNYLYREKDFDEIDRDWAIRAILGLDENFEFEIISNEDWVGRRLVADRFRDRRVFICGDASHLWIPMAGYGMNAGIADATNLSWMLSAVINGWGDSDLLEAYELERQPITEQVSRYAMDIATRSFDQRGHLPDAIEEPGPEGDAVRRDVGRSLYDVNVPQFCCGGLNFGYFYDNSPILAYDGEKPPTYSMYDFEQSTVPGCRAPHVWVSEGESLYDRLGLDYSLVRIAPDADVARLLAAAKAAGMPLKLVDIDRKTAGDSYTYPLTIIRPDLHVFWRGQTAPANPGALVDLMCGRQRVQQSKIA
ncbi:FAD-dependent oxidoreductase [Hoeflea sp. CAU 1731]